MVLVIVNTNRVQVPAIICRAQLEIVCACKLGRLIFVLLFNLFLDPPVKAYSGITDIPRRVEMFYPWAATELS